MKIFNLLTHQKLNLNPKQTLTKKIISQLADLRLAIILLLLIALFSALGTIIEQNKNLNFYKLAYPDTVQFWNWKTIYYLQLDKIYQAWWYILLVITLGCSLITCTIRTQYPSFKIARKYLFFTSLKKFQKLPLYKKVPKKGFSFLLKTITTRSYYLFYKKANAYAYTGLIGKIAPIGIHFSLLFLLLGIGVSSSTGYLAQEMVVKGELFHIQNLSNFGYFSYFPQTLVGRVNNFWITYQQNTIEQFFSSISILDKHYNSQKTEVVFVNKPLKHSGVTIYQTDWNLVGIRLLLDNKFYVQIPLQQTITNNKQTIWSGSLVSKSQQLVSFGIQDLKSNKNYWVYNSEGIFLEKTQIDSPLLINKHQIQILDVISATGLQIKQDSGILFVYLGFFFLMLSIIINTNSYVEIWISQTKTCLHLAAKSTKDPAKLESSIFQMLKMFHLRQID